MRYHSNFSGRFLGELKIRKRHFEINRPLVSKAACNLVHFHMHTFYSIGRSRLKIEIAFGWNYFQGCWNVWDMGKLSPPSYNRIFTFYCHSSSKIVSLKVRWFRNNFWYPRILPKNERTNSFLVLLGKKTEFVRSFFGRIRGYQKLFRNFLTFNLVSQFKACIRDRTLHCMY